LQKTAIFGGTFNPPHIGHRAMLEGVAALPEIFKILIMPAKTPPHKSGDIVLPEHRVNMCKLAFNGVKKAEICLEELNMEGKNYTVNTLLHLSKKGVDNPVLVIGADSLVNFHKCRHQFRNSFLQLGSLYTFYPDSSILF